jgi:hypothetical protein
MKTEAKVKKYKFTGKEKKHLGKTLKQIVCVVAFSNVSVGDVGGWIETKQNLAVSGDAWVSGDARVSGKSIATKKVITISSKHHHVTITDNHIIIGCQVHTIKQWSKMTKKQITEMENEESAKLWFKSKSFILMLAENQ